MGIFGKSKKEREKEYMNKLDVKSSVIALHSATGCLPETESLVPGGSHGAYSVCAAVLVS